MTADPKKSLRVKEKRWTTHDLTSMSRLEWQTFTICLRAGAYRLLGINYREWIQWSRDPVTDDVVVRWL